MHGRTRTDPGGLAGYKQHVSPCFFCGCMAAGWTTLAPLPGRPCATPGPFGIPWGAQGTGSPVAKRIGASGGARHMAGPADPGGRLRLCAHALRTPRTDPDGPTRRSLRTDRPGLRSRSDGRTRTTRPFGRTDPDSVALRTDPDSSPKRALLIHMDGEY